jgi:hypothetical protein
MKKEPNVKTMPLNLTMSLILLTSLILLLWKGMPLLLELVQKVQRNNQIIRSHNCNSNVSYYIYS